MTAADIISFSAKMRKKDCTENAKELCQRLQLDTSKKVEELSLGNRKKVGIVCALQHKPSLYILDEPTSGLDPLMQREFYSILKERNEQGATVFLSSHVLSEIARYCKTAAVIREGKILVCDKVDKLGHTGVKRVTLRGVNETISIEGARDVKLENEGQSFLYDGEIKALLDTLAKMPLTDLNINDPDLDEIFMHYYAKGDM
jgi:ABC-2 type transport system ATP-binding protein